MSKTSSIPHIQFNTSIHRLEHLLNMHYLVVPKKIVQALGGKLKIRLLCTVNKTLTFHCGLMALGEGKAYISLNKKRMTELGLKAGDKAAVILQKDTSKYGMEVPVELSELLKQDEEGKRRFSLLPAGKQRYILHYVSSVKSSQLRINRAILLIENLKKLPIGNESFREMLGLPR